MRKDIAYGGGAALRRIRRVLDGDEPTITIGVDLAKGRDAAVWMERVGPNRMVTHYVGDDCAPDGHLSDAR